MHLVLGCERNWYVEFCYLENLGFRNPIKVILICVR